MATKKPTPPAVPEPPALRYQVGNTPILRNGVLYPPGSTIELTAPQAARLRLVAVLPTTLQLMPLDTPE